MPANCQRSERPSIDELNIDVVSPRASFDTPPSRGDFGELLLWCDSFSYTLHDIIDQLHDEITQMAPPSSTAAAQHQSCDDWRQITDVVEQIHDIVEQLERVSKRATPLAYKP